MPCAARTGPSYNIHPDVVSPDQNKLNSLALASLNGLFFRLRITQCAHMAATTAKCSRRFQNSRLRRQFSLAPDSVVKESFHTNAHALCCFGQGYS